MFLKKIIPIILLILTITACSQKNVKKQESVLITMKTNSVKFSDLGFIYFGSNRLKIEVYATGQALLNLDIYDDSICLSLLECMDKSDFNERVLSNYYPKTLLENVFQGKAIFDAKNIEKMDAGFKQKLFELGKYDIDYSVVRGNRVFRDKINKILIKVREVE